MLFQWTQLKEKNKEEDGGGSTLVCLLLGLRQSSPKNSSFVKKKKKKKTLWQLRWTSLGMISCVPHSQPVLLPGFFQRRLCLELRVRSPHLLWACSESQHSTVETIRGPQHSPSLFMHLPCDFGEVSDLPELQIPTLWILAFFLFWLLNRKHGSCPIQSLCLSTFICSQLLGFLSSHS